MEVTNTYIFRVTRDADMEIEEDEASDLLTAIETSVEQRRIGIPSRLEVHTAMPEWIRDLLTAKLRLMPTQVYVSTSGLIGMNDLIELTDIDRPDLKDIPFKASVPSALPSLRQLHPGRRVRQSRSPRPQRPRHQTDPLPDRQKLPDRPRPHGSTRGRKTRNRSGGTESTLRRGE